jgi:hypothetical protein
MIEQFKETVSTQLNLPASQVFGGGWTLAEVLARSPKAINSIDLMEAFAFAMAHHGLEERINLPAFTLDDNIDEVIAEVEQQLNAG